MDWGRDLLVKMVLECRIWGGQKWDLDMVGLVREKLGDVLIWCIDRWQIGWDLDKRESECNLLNIVRFGIKMWVKWGNGVENVGLLFSWWGIGFGFWVWCRSLGVYFWVSVYKNYLTGCLG